MIGKWSETDRVWCFDWTLDHTERYIIGLQHRYCTYLHGRQADDVVLYLHTVRPYRRRGPCGVCGPGARGGSGWIWMGPDGGVMDTTRGLSGCVWECKVCTIDDDDYCGTGKARQKGRIKVRKGRSGTVQSKGSVKKSVRRAGGKY